MSLRPALFAVALFGVLSFADQGHAAKSGPGPKTPNILFVVMDDVGIDQMETFGYGGDTPPAMPSIESIADAGIRFRNAWAMPACTTSRAVVFDARFPFRNNVLGALGPDDLANSMVSPYETTLPKLLATRGYKSALFGKFHITQQQNDPAGVGSPHALGWDFYAGWMDDTGDPATIDSTAGGVAPDGVKYTCGFVPSAAAGGADSGACYMPSGACTNIGTQNGVPPGRICRDRGGLLDPNASCAAQVPAHLDFGLVSGHYVSPLVYNHPDGQVEEVPLTDRRARAFRATFAVDAAATWINSRPDDEPWMATVSFASDHTPLMQPPFDSKIAGNAQLSDINCADPSLQQQLSNLLIEQMDTEIGRLLVRIGLAKRGKNGELVYRPHATDTMVVVLGDNGSLGATVKTPFDVIRSKGTAYQTGVWVPLVVSGPLMRGPDRSVPHMVNVADLYSLFAEIAGIDDVKAAVPRPIDAEPMLPYVTNPKQESIREWNFTQVGVNLQAGGSINGPCTIGGTCTQIPVTKGVCEDNSGIWWGDKHDHPATAGIPEEGFQYCCQVNEYVVAGGCTPGLGCPFGITPLVSMAIRDDKYKIVQNQVKAYVSQDEPCVDTPTTEFFEINEDAPLPLLDAAGLELPLDALTPEQQHSYDTLSTKLAELLASHTTCPGDGTIDFRVDQDDLDGWSTYQGASSWFDFDLDGDTDEDDRQVILDHLGTVCAAGALPQESRGRGGRKGRGAAHGTLKASR